MGDPADSGDPTRLVLAFLSWLGLLLLMFISGSEIRRPLAREQRGPTLWILGIGTAVPFVIAFAIGAALQTHELRGPNGGKIAFLVVLATAAAVTSIPVISRIFHDLKIMHTRFASLILGTAMLEDIALFAALAIATALAQPGGDVDTGEVVTHIAVTVAYLLVGLLLAPKVLRSIVDQRWNVLARRAQVGYALVLMLAYTSVAAAVETNVVFGAFLAGFGLVGGFQGRSVSGLPAHSTRSAGSRSPASSPCTSCSSAPGSSWEPGSRSSSCWRSSSGRARSEGPSSPWRAAWRASAAETPWTSPSR